MNEIEIGQTEVTALEYEGQRVVTLAMVDKVHQRPEGTAKRNFNRNRDRFVEGQDRVALNQPDEIRTLGLGCVCIQGFHFHLEFDSRSQTESDFEQKNPNRSAVGAHRRPAPR